MCDMGDRAGVLQMIEHRRALVQSAPFEIERIVAKPPHPDARPEDRLHVFTNQQLGRQRNHEVRVRRVDGSSDAAGGLAKLCAADISTNPR